MEAQALSVQPRGQIQRRSQLQRMSQLQRGLHFQGLILLLQRYKLLLQSGGVASSWTLAATEAPPTIPRPNRVAQVLLPPCLRLEPQNFPNGFSLSLRGLALLQNGELLSSCCQEVGQPISPSASSWETLLLRAGVRHKSWRNSSSLSASALALALTPGVVSPPSHCGVK